MIRLIKKILNQYFNNRKKASIFLLFSKNYTTSEDIEETQKRIAFYFGKDNIQVSVKSISHPIELLLYLFSPKIKLLFGFKIEENLNNKILNFNFFDIDYKENPNDGWRWHSAITRFFKSNEVQQIEIVESRKRFKDYIDSLPKYEKSYILGTGPSLAKATNLDWSDGYTIVCNTIVKDKALWEKINPNFIVAGDAIYHFGHNDFAKAFLGDLKLRLEETNTFFVYPYMFHAFLERELINVKEKLIPIPTDDFDSIHENLIDNFYLPGKIGNVLNLLLLPLGCTLSKNVYLFGFDGRAPSDKLFWSNSEEHTYKEKMSEIIKCHPKFFEYHVPNSNQNNYVLKVHGEALEKILTMAESQGWHFVMMHKSWTETLQNRFSDTSNTLDS